MFEVFRFALFAVRTFFGAILLILALYAALWVFVKIDSTAKGNVDSDAALRRVMSYNAQAIRHRDGKRKASTKAKAAASRRNGKLGGRPRTLEDILAAIAYGAEAVRERVIPVPTTP